jgi:cyclic di-GMP phosphodiesterase
MNKQSVLIVDDTPENIDVLNGILSPKYDVKVAINGKMALKIAQKLTPDIILLDIMMPGMDGYETCKLLKADKITAAIPVIFVTALGSEDDESKGFEVGCVDYITKPVSRDIVLARVATHLTLFDQQRATQLQVIKRTAELDASQKAAIHMLGDAGHYNDDNTGVHIWRMAAYSGAIARAMGWHVDKADSLELAAPMHDTGKIGIPDAILKKPAKLTLEEWKIMKSHSAVGHKILSQSKTPLFLLAADIALYHHEKWNGNGYPEGIKGKEIPESARIVAIADVFDALTMKRPYKDAWSVEKAMEEIKNCSASHFDPDMVSAFLRIEKEIREIKEKWDNKDNPV